MTDEPKFCKDCRHYTPAMANPYASVFAKCSHPEFRSLVTGVAAADPRLMREGRCGSIGALWEEKPPAPPEVPEPVRQFTQADADAENARMKRATYQPCWWEFWK